jgi:hypothetical protein
MQLIPTATDAIGLKFTPGKLETFSISHKQDNFSFMLAEGERFKLLEEKKKTRLGAGYVSTPFFRVLR